MNRRSTYILAIVVAVAGVAVFLPAITGGWIYDDRPLIDDNVYIHSFAEWPHWFLTDFWNVSGESVKFGSRILYWRPGVTATYALDWLVGGGSPLMFHITNYVLQAITGALAFLALRRWIGKTAPALIAALIFVVHPTKAESVAWIAGRTDVICMLAVLLASAGFARRLSGRHGGIAMEVGGTIIAYLCKEQAIVLPCFVAVEAWVALDRPALDRAAIVKLVRAAIPQAAIALGYLAVRTIVMPIGPAGGSPRIPLGKHVIAVLETLGRFFALAVAPHDLSIQQGLVHTSHHLLVWSPFYVVLGVISTLALGLAASWTRRRAPMIALGIVFYFVTLLPTSNVVYTSMMTLISERFLYLPLLGLALALGGVLARVDGRTGARIYALATAAACVFALLAFDRANDYRDEDAFWARELRMHPDSGEARSEAFAHAARDRHYAAALAVYQRDHQDYDSTPREYVKVSSDVAGVLAHLVPDHDTKDLEQINQFCMDVLAQRPAHLDVRGVTFTLTSPVLIDNRDFEESRHTLQLVRIDLLSRLGRDGEAVALAYQAAQTCPTCFSLLSSLGLALARAGRYDDALEVIDTDVHAPEQAVAREKEQIDAAHELAEQAATDTGPAALQAHASELAKLELWGRAFDVLAPYEAEIAKAPNFVEGFAELAVRAGEPQVARRVLAPTKSPADIDALIAGWTAKMGWSP